MLFQKVSIIGMGLLGGSIGLALRRLGLAARVEGFARRAETATEADQLGVADRVTTELEPVVSGAELIILCTPVEHMAHVLAPVVTSLAAGTIVTDVGSVKSGVVRELEALLAGTGIHFVGSHPMAGGERIGVTRARADLFDHAVCALTPTDSTNATALERVAGLWEGLGMRVLQLSPDRHDELVSRASHLPHLLASVLAAYVLDPRFPREQRELCAGGFRDATRIASGPVTMWRGILGANRHQLAGNLDDLIGLLGALREDLQTGRLDQIETLLQQAHDRRELWLAGGAKYSSHGAA